MDHDEWAALYDSLDGNGDDKEVIEENLEVAVAGGTESVAKTLVGKLISSKAFNQDTIFNAISGFWKINGIVKIESVGNNKFLFQFSDLADRRKVLGGGPWLIEKQLLVLDAPTGIGNYTKLVFDRVKLWVQFHLLPFCCMTEDMGRELGDSLAQLLRLIPTPQGIAWGNLFELVYPLISQNHCQSF